MSVLTLQQFGEAYRKQNPHDRVEEPAAVRRNWAVIIPLFIGLIAANILSAFHTGPLIASAFKASVYTNEYNLMFFVGVLAVEFTVFVTMFVPWDTKDRRSTVLRVLVIIMAIAVSVIANVSATLTNLGTTGIVEQIGAGLVGVFAPFANLAIAEVLRTILDQTKRETAEARAAYNLLLNQADQKMRTRYVKYLAKYGITDPTEIMKLSAGEVQVKSLPTEPEIEVDPREQINLNLPPPEPPAKAITRAELLANDLVRNNHVAMSYKDIERQYGTNPATVSAAKKILKERGLI